MAVRRQLDRGHQARAARPPRPCWAAYRSGLAGGPGHRAHRDVDAAGRLGVTGVAPLCSRESRNDKGTGEAPLAKQEAQGGAGGRAQTGPDQCLGPLADAQVARGGDGWGLRVQGSSRCVEGVPAA